MNIVCAKCGAGVAYERSALSDQTVIACSACRSGLKVTIQAFDVPAAAASSAPVAAPSTRMRAMVAVQGEATRELIRELLSSAGYEVVEVTSGAETLAKVPDQRPGVVLVDVGLADMPGYQVCEAIRGQAGSSGVRMILIAAIHNKDRYRRPPDNLFGADDYIERHQIENELLDKIARLLGGGSTAATATTRVPETEPGFRATPVAESTSVPPRGGGATTDHRAAPAAEAPPPQPVRVPPPSEPARPIAVSPEPGVAASRANSAPPPVAEAPTGSAPAPAATNPALEAALRLARIIVSDIALYNAKKVDEGVMNGTFFDLLRHEIEEGRKLYEERKGPGLTTTADLFQQTLEQFVATRRELLKRNRPAAA
jgi:CheY-like chemotaxis protein